MGLNHIYCGNGKGKTTAALGLAIRGAGHGMKVCIFQFLKSSDTSELKPLEKTDGISVIRSTENFGFTFQMSDEEKQRVSRIHNEMLLKAKALTETKGADMLIFDELLDAYNLNLLDRNLADEICLRHYDTIEIIITGRDSENKFLASADYVSEIKAIKHPYEKGITARPGIEY